MTYTADSTLIHRVRLRNYKSIAACDVVLGPLTFLVGPNGAGKSNFLDALRLVAEALNFSLRRAIRERWGLSQVLRKSIEHPGELGIRLDLVLPGGQSGHFALEVATKGKGYEIRAEECYVRDGAGGVRAWYRVQAGQPSGSFEPLPPASLDSLYLVAVSGLPSFRLAYDSLSQMSFYNFNPGQIAKVQPVEEGNVLAWDGRNIASVIAQLEAREPHIKRRIEEYLSKITPGIKEVKADIFGSMASLEFMQEVTGSAEPWRFMATNMSDGTLRTLGVLVALFQSAEKPEPRVPLVGIEEPEVALHPSAAEVLMDSLRDASQQRQILITSHSPDLLDNPNVADHELLAVIAEKNETRMGRLDEAGRSALRDHLYTAGELLRANQLQPDEVSRTLTAEHLYLFDTPRD
ncbi:AAA family ATPase [Pyxidicoccus sp. 3LFB2]